MKLPKIGDRVKIIEIRGNIGEKFIGKIIEVKSFFDYKNGSSCINQYQYDHVHATKFQLLPKKTVKKVKTKKETKCKMTTSGRHFWEKELSYNRSGLIFHNIDGHKWCIACGLVDY